MNGLQLAQQIAARLRAATWPGGSQGKVFQLVRQHAGQVTSSQFPPGDHWALVATQDFRPDPNTPYLGQQEVSVFYVAGVMGDTQGGMAVTGGPIQDIGSSANRGVEEIHPLVAEACADLSGMDGAELIVTGGRRVGAVPFGERGGKMRHKALGRTDVEAWCSSQPYYAAPQLLEWDGSAWTWEGAHCASRYDFVGYELVVHTSLEDPLANGVSLYAGTAPSATVAAPTEGLYYCAFAHYSSRGRANLVEGTSELDRGAWRRWD